MEFNDIKELLAMLEGTDISELFYEKDGVKIKIRKGVPPLRHAPQPQQQQQLPIQKTETPATPTPHNVFTVTSPIVGTFYSSPTPDAANFVNVGDRIRKGQTLCIIEAMKLMNAIESEVDGVLEKVLVENEQAVEYGEPLFLITLN